MSNIVTSVDRRFVQRDVSTAREAESLKGKISVADMGSNIARSQPPSSSLSKQAVVNDRPQKKLSKRPTRFNDDDIEGDLTYVANTPVAREVLDLIMSWVQSYLEDVSHETIRSAADAILVAVKDQALKDSEKKKEVEDIVGPVTNEHFSQLESLCRRMPDIEENESPGKTGADDEIGVAVTFEGDDDDEGIDGLTDEEDEEDIDDEPSLQAPVETSQTLENESEIIKGTSTSENSKEATLPAHELDAYWLQRRLSPIFTDAHLLQEKTAQVFEILASPMSLGQAENEIMELFDFDHFDLAKFLCLNRSKIVWLTRFNRAETGIQRDAILSDMVSAGLQDIVDELRGTSQEKTGMDVDAPEEEPQEAELARRVKTSKLTPNLVDLDSLIFDEGSHLYTGGKITLPEGSYKSPPTKTYEQYNIPAPKKHYNPSEMFVRISELPEWTHPAFEGTASLNTIQSHVFPMAFGSEENLLICAPTGAGKTNIALLTILRAISQYRNARNNQFELEAFKIVYIAPLKALVQEQVREFGKKLAPFGIQVAELTGDRNLTKQQMSQTQVIVTTPEKWDVITRKSSDTSYANLVRLIIIDEIHLLHDERGPVLESIVARTIRRSEATGESVRLVGLSATLPNYKDVARFIRVEKGLFYFDASYRPCPLEQKFIGITEKKAIKRYQAMNDACFDKVMEYAGKQQVIIFVHSRKETAKTAKFLRDRASEEGVLNKFLKSDIASREILRSESELVSNSDLKDLLPTGFAIHHAGLRRADRSSAEELFAAGQVQVLVSTATLAWGVNLPAHTVIIKGTQVYNPQRGRWTELSPQDVIQMLGRAGRPRYDNYGEGIIITAHTELNYYMSLLNAKLPIESQFMSKLADNLNAEIVLGNVRTRDDAVEWLGYSYLYVRMLKSPSIYRVGENYSNDKFLVKKRLDLVHSALVALSQSRLVKYDEENGRIQSSELGRIASHFYISHTSIATYNNMLTPYLSPIEIFRIFSLSEEFKNIPVRQEEKLELSKLIEMAPIPVKETIEEPAAKINILLQAYICRLKLDGFALAADMVYVTQSAGRLFRAIYEICLGKRWAGLTRTTLDICKMVAERMWLSNTPLRQFPDAPAEVIRKMEASQMPWNRYFDLTDPAEVGQAIRVERAGSQVFRLLQQFPRLELNAQFQPVTPSLLRVELEITPKFEWNRNVHGSSESFIILVEDCDGEVILFSDTFVLKEQYATEEHIVEFTVPISDPIPPNYFVSVISEKWLHSEARLVMSFKDLIVPSKFPAHTPTFDLEPMQTSELNDKEYESLYPWKTFNRIQTQTFNTLYGSDSNVFVGAAPGNGTGVCAELAILRLWNESSDGKAVYVAPFEDQIQKKLLGWRFRLSSIHGGKEINKLTGELSNDLKILERSSLVLATPTQWDAISRKWHKRRNVQKVRLFIADDVHMIGGLNGSVYEIIISRMRYMSAQLESGLRLVALGVSLANGKDLGEWIGATSQTIFNFSPKERMYPLEIHLQSLGIPHHPSLMIAMARPTFQAVTTLADGRPSLIFVNDLKQCIDTSMDLQRLAFADCDSADIFRRVPLEELSNVSKIVDQDLADSVEHGIGYLYPAMSSRDRVIVEDLFNRNLIGILIATRETCWTSPKAQLVVVMGTQLYEGREHRYIDYPISELLQMIGRASDPSNSKTLILTNTTKRDYYKKFLNEALPIESHLNLYLHDAFIAEISERVITSPEDAVDWLTYSYFYRRLKLNPSYYGITDQSDNGLNEYLSELVETTLQDLSEAQLIEYDEDQEESPITVLNGAFIAAYYNISFITMQTFSLSLGARSKRRNILEIISSAAEFENIPIRNHEDLALSRLHERVPYKLSEPAPGTTRFKAFVLLQAHISRLTLPPDLVSDQKLILEKTLQLLSASVDVLSGNGHLNALQAMDLCQMVVQATWDKDSPLKQIPYFTDSIIERCNSEQ
ncbi:Brr2p [Sugiyamaella lignohabitans]|uniref:Brr2p n=1 Tax=Sugiyamaella lignohabitans TaxID=796027 RepID=A0A167FZE2_9ASCO|nr:Brr2p [Sugiyamaella lignohabitans]ANB15899.1 Brr2p [Sugiyamaella lignohabitans]